jgi:hypothetical protein
LRHRDHAEGRVAPDSAIDAYGEQTLKDHAALVKAIKSGRVEAVHDV